MKFDSRVTLSVDAQATLDAIEAGNVLDIVNPLAWNRAPYLYFTDTTMITVGTITDTAAIAYTIAVLEIDKDHNKIILLRLLSHLQQLQFWHLL
jgi:hypothetical protein